jgi:hypothetical protein
MLHTTKDSRQTIVKLILVEVATRACQCDADERLTDHDGGQRRQPVGQVLEVVRRAFDLSVETAEHDRPTIRIPVTIQRRPEMGWGRNPETVAKIAAARMRCVAESRTRRALDSSAA